MAPKDNIKEIIEEKLRSYGYLQKDQHVDDNLRKRIEYALNWTRDFEEIKETAVTLNEQQKAAVEALIQVLQTEDEPDKIQNGIFILLKTMVCSRAISSSTLYHTDRCAAGTKTWTLRASHGQTERYHCTPKSLIKA